MIKEFYIGRLNEGWSLPEIDNTDFFYWIDLIAYKSKSEIHTIDEIF